MLFLYKEGDIIKKNEFKIGEKIYTADKIGWEYQLQEGDKAGRGDDGSMFHDVVGMLKKVYYDFIDYRDEDGTSELINLLDQTDAMVTYYDLKAKDFVTKSMYVSGDKIEASLIDDEFYANPFQLRFTANKVE